jgi:hypothetical protein
MGDDMLEREKIFNQIKIFQKIPECYGVVYGPSIMLNTLTNKKYFVDVVKINYLIFRFSIRDSSIWLFKG